MHRFGDRQISPLHEVYTTEKKTENKLLRIHCVINLPHSTSLLIILFPKLDYTYIRGLLNSPSFSLFVMRVAESNSTS